MENNGREENGERENGEGARNTWTRALLPSAREKKKTLFSIFVLFTPIDLYLNKHSSSNNRRWFKISSKRRWRRETFLLLFWTKNNYLFIHAFLWGARTFYCGSLYGTGMVHSRRMNSFSWRWTKWATRKKAHLLKWWWDLSILLCTLNASWIFSLSLLEVERGYKICLFTKRRPLNNRILAISVF